MPNERRVKLDNFGISKYAYDELRAFCLQYPEKKKKIADLHNPLKGVCYNGMPHGSTPGEPTATAAERAATLSVDCELIEQTAIEADSGIYQYLLLAVTEKGINYEILRACKDIPCGREYFYLRRRYFFHRLAEKKGMI